MKTMKTIDKNVKMWCNFSILCLSTEVNEAGKFCGWCFDLIANPRATLHGHEKPFSAFAAFQFLAVRQPDGVSRRGLAGEGLGPGRAHV